MSYYTDFKVKNGLVVNTTATFLSTITSTSTTTGAVQISGGIGIAKDAWVGGAINIASTTSATNTVSGALQVVGGVGIQGDLYARNIYMNGVLVGTGNTGNTGYPPFPVGDYAEDEAYPGEVVVDAFGVSLQENFNCMNPEGVMLYEDLGVLT